LDRFVSRRKAIRYKRLIGLGTCLSRPARQDVAMVSWLRICIEQTEKSESSGEQIHPCGLLVVIFCSLLT
jgi:hypothetical protein